jgi:hypothetical protein
MAKHILAGISFSSPGHVKNYGRMAANNMQFSSLCAHGCYTLVISKTAGLQPPTMTPPALG